jgi:hypothetical protein
VRKQLTQAGDRLPYMDFTKSAEHAWNTLRFCRGPPGVKQLKHSSTATTTRPLPPNCTRFKINSQETRREAAVQTQHGDIRVESGLLSRLYVTHISRRRAQAELNALDRSTECGPPDQKEASTEEEAPEAKPSEAQNASTLLRARDSTERNIVHDCVGAGSDSKGGEPLRSAMRFHILRNRGRGQGREAAVRAEAEYISTLRRSARRGEERGRTGELWREKRRGVGTTRVKP